MRRTPLLALVLTAAGLASLAACGTPDDSDAGGSPDGPITVEALIARSTDTPVAVTGLLYAADGTVELCSAVLESFPVQCGKPAVELVGVDVTSVEGTTSEQGITWKEGFEVTVERDAEGRFVVVEAATE